MPGKCGGTAATAHLPRPEAQALVKAACKEVLSKSGHLLDVLPERADVAIDWAALRNPAGQLGAAGAFIDRVLAEGGHLIDRLAARSDAPVDWEALRDPAGQLGSADAFIDRVIGARSGASTPRALT